MPPRVGQNESNGAAEDFGKRLSAALEGKPLDHLRQVFEYHKHTDWMFHQRLAIGVTLNAGLLALFSRARDTPAVGLGLIALGLVASVGMWLWTGRLIRRIKILSPFLQKDPIYDLYVKAFPRRAFVVHYTAASCGLLAWLLALWLWLTGK